MATTSTIHYLFSPRSLHSRQLEYISTSRQKMKADGDSLESIERDGFQLQLASFLGYI